MTTPPPGPDNANGHAPTFTARIEAVNEGPPRRDLFVVRQPEIGRNFIIYCPQWAGAFEAGYRQNWWYYRAASDWTAGPRSTPFRTAEEAAAAALGSPIRFEVFEVDEDLFDDDGAEGELDPDG